MNSEVAEITETDQTTEGVAKVQPENPVKITKPRVWVQVNCEQGSPITLHIENLLPFSNEQIDNSLIDDECLGFCLMMRGEQCVTHNRIIPKDKRLVVSYIFQNRHKKRYSELQTASLKIDFLISNDGEFRPSKFKDPRRFDDTEARAFLMNELFFFAKHLQAIFDTKYEVAQAEQIAPDYLSVGEVHNKGGKIFVPPTVASPLDQFGLPIKVFNYDYA